MFDTLKARFASEELTPGVRMLATLNAIINLPGFVFAIGCSMFLIPIPGIFFYIYTLIIAFGKARPHTALFVAVLGVLYDAILLGSMLISHDFDLRSVEPIYLGAMAVLLTTIGFGSLMIRILLEKEKEARNRSVVQVYEEEVAAVEPEHALA